MRSLRFFLHLFVLALLSGGACLRLAFDSWSAYWEALLDIEASLEQAGKQVAHYFRHADPWNWLATIALVSTLLLVFTLLDFVLRRVLLARAPDGWRFHFRWLGVKMLSFLLTGLTFVFFTNYLVMHYSTPRILYSVDSFNPQARVDLIVLGTRKFLSDNRSLNTYYEARIDAANHLYRSGIIRNIIVSGDRKDHTYDEPRWMRQDLINLGVPSERVIMDPAGYRTLDSVVRLRDKFGFTQAVFVSQGFHLQRALFLAWYFNIDAYGFSSGGNMTGKMAARELLAKPKLFLDIFVFNTQPREGRVGSRRSFQLEADDLMLLGFTLTLLFVALYVSFLSFE